MQIRALFCLLLFGLMFKVSGQSTCNFSGTISSGGKPVDFASVVLWKTNFSVLSDEKGKFTISNIPPGTYTLVISCVGFDTWKQNIHLKEGTVHKNIELVSISSNLDEVVVTGTMKEVSRKESPVAIEVVSPKLFQKSPVPNIFEGLGMVNGIRPQIQCNVCNTGDIHINGMEGAYTMVLIDGMPIVSALSTVYGLMGIPNSIIERIEIQRGPASTLYGSEAVGGLINVITKHPLRAPLFSADVYATSYNEYNTDLSFKWNIGKKVTSMISLNHYNMDKHWDRNKDHFTDVTLQNRISVFNKWSLKRKNDRAFNVGFRYYYEDRYGGEMNWTPQFRGTDSVYGESIYTARTELIGQYQLPLKREKVMLNVSINRHHQNSVYGRTFFLADQQISFAQLTWDKNLGLRHKLLTGVAARYTFYDDNTPITRVSDAHAQVNKPMRTFLPGVFVQDEINLTARHTLLLGVRYDHNSQHGAIVSPRLNHRFKINNNNIMRLGIGNGYRVVNLFSEEHAAYTGAREVVIQHALKPERSWNASLNYNKYINLKQAHVTLDASMYYTYFYNRIVADYFTDANKVIFDNLSGHGINRGINCNVEASFTNSLRLQTGFTLVDVFLTAKDSLGNNRLKRQVQTPPLTANFLASYTFRKLKLTTDVSGSVYSPMILPVLPNDFRPGHSPWFCLLNIQFTRSFAKGFEVYAGVKNLLNFVPANPIMRPHDPFDKHIHDPVNNPNGYTFDPNYNYAPLQGIRLQVGFRFILK